MFYWLSSVNYTSSGILNANASITHTTFYLLRNFPNRVTSTNLRSLFLFLLPPQLLYLPIEARPIHDMIIVEPTPAPEVFSTYYTLPDGDPPALADALRRHDAQ